MKKWITVLSVGLLTLIISGCEDLLVDTSKIEDVSGVKKVRQEIKQEANQELGITTSYVIGDKIVGTNNVYEEMNFVGFVNNTLVIAYESSPSRVYTLYYPLEENYVTTPLQTETNSDRSQYKIMAFDVKKGTLDLKKVR